MDASKSSRNWLFALTVVSAWLYCLEVAILGAMEPGYSHMRQFASELGMADAAHPRAFFVIVFVEAVLLVMAGWYGYRAVRKLTGRAKLAGVIGVFLACLGANYFFVAFFPLPDPRHSGFGIALFVFFVPWLLAWAFWSYPGARRFCYAQILATPILVISVLLNPAFFDFVTESNQGLYQRIGAILMYGWLVLTGLWLNRSLRWGRAASAQ